MKTSCDMPWILQASDPQATLGTRLRITPYKQVNAIFYPQIMATKKMFDATKGHSELR
jgi:hypothetical protein